MEDLGNRIAEIEQSVRDLTNGEVNVCRETSIL